MTDYSASSIRVLKDLEPVKERPGMYTRTDDPTHIIQEVIDNAADEALAKFAKRISVTVKASGLIEVSDNGRGIPVDVHPEEGKPAVELVFSKLHAGGKFNKKDSGNAYRFSGGLHGVGVSVTNALSSRLEVEVKREGGVYQMAFEDGFVVEPLQQVGDCGPRTSGTTVRIQPNPKYFDSPKVNLRLLEHLLRSKAVLMPGVTVTLEVDGQEKKEWCYTTGMAEYLAEMLTADSLVPIFVGEKYVETENGFAVGEGASWALTWTEEGSSSTESYVNLIPTLEGGTHEAGLKSGVFEAVKAFAEHHAMLPAKVKLAQDDVCNRMTFLLSAKVLDPQFQGQTKEKLTSRDAYKLITAMVRDPVELWLNSNAEYGKKIAELAVKAAQNRMRATQKVEKKKSSGIATLPGKLTDCESDDITRNEVFLVEGDSAGGSAKQGRDKETQAVLPLRGKVLNTWEVERDQLFKNNEVHDISVAIGVDPHDIADMDKEGLLAHLRYGRIIVMSDADVDGSHIQVLLFTLFLKHFPKLVENGNIYVAQPPLYRVDAETRGHTKKVYCLDESEKEQAMKKLRDEGVSDHRITVSRFKGLGEMNPEQLWETTLCPDTRRMVPFQATREEIEIMRDTFTLLMGKNQAAGRREWMERDGGTVEADA
ncbi:topoisomerase IV subunit B [Novimethylophilus kurashikiensis]|uniref:DNA topoisomerase 4 subunit B n=1 Tax=Novimethylophilus kurashikiensis TaxID=1825523 RepID=A0A2R5FBK3_9PROT|nr:DNA topoisomerase IV subunit B [Novimethylophilus kurashikiensis]GBG14283.1 topoisomerase IV subunit B [Novimethylophilus kurashikiensis]